MNLTDVQNPVHPLRIHPHMTSFQQRTSPLTSHGSCKKSPLRNWCNLEIQLQYFGVIITIRNLINDKIICSTVPYPPYVKQYSQVHIANFKLAPLNDWIPLSPKMEWILLRITLSFCLQKLPLSFLHCIIETCLTKVSHTNQLSHLQPFQGETWHVMWSNLPRVWPVLPGKILISWFEVGVKFMIFGSCLEISSSDQMDWIIKRVDVRNYGISCYWLLDPMLMFRSLSEVYDILVLLRWFLVVTRWIR